MVRDADYDSYCNELSYCSLGELFDLSRYPTCLSLSLSVAVATLSTYSERAFISGPLSSRVCLIGVCGGVLVIYHLVNMVCVCL